MKVKLYNLSVITSFGLLAKPAEAVSAFAKLLTRLASADCPLGILRRRAKFIIGIKMGVR